MPLGDVLDDIKENIENISNEDISQENLEIKNMEVRGNNNISVDRFSKDTLSKINNMFNLVMIQNNIKTLERVEYSIAQEVFTMLPELSDNKVEQAKLTSAPSIINKEIITKVFNTSIDGKFSEDTFNKVYELKNLIEANLDKFEELYNYLNTFKELIESKLLVLTTVPPLVVFQPAVYATDDLEKKSVTVNLLTDKITDILNIDDNKLEYVKYAGVLYKKYWDLSSDSTLELLSSTDPVNLSRTEISLKSFINSTFNLLGVLERKERNLKEYITGLNVINSGKIDLNADTIDYVNGHDSMAYDLEFLSKVYNVTKEPNNCFDKIVELMLFL